MNSTLTGTPLRGREREMRLIREVLERGLRGGSAVVAVEGMPGIGKTRLLQEAAALAARLGYIGGNRPDAGRRAAPHTPPAPARRVRGRAGKCHAPAGPTLVLLDDPRRTPHGAHAPGVLPEPLPAGPTRERPGGDPVVWLVTHRPGEGPLLPGALAGRSERLPLGPLGPSSTLALARDLLGATPSPSLVQLVDRVGGHPRLLIELLTGLGEEGGLEFVDDEVRLRTQRLPARLVTRVRATLGRFSPACRQLLHVAAVLGDEVVYEDVALMLRTSVAALLPALEEVEATGVVRNDGVRAAFANPLLRRVITDSMPDSLRLSLQREAVALRAAYRERREPHLGIWPAPPVVPTTAEGLREAPAAAGSGLNEQQRILVGLVGEGLTNQQIARRLALSPHTVNYHLRKLYKAFGVSSRIDLLSAVEQPGATPGHGARAHQN
ncbi:LuxR C-terminal-related transcriptional regulator [Streptomyces sp. NPDC060334]|uniref:LuxR C-terminal-related transcriptional regulator n=1 Tax=unclassified Streptomyces TaxID=2593676 RepID=UPI003663096A